MKGYAIGGKTGTSEDGVNTNKYVTSFVGVADVKDPEVVIAVILYNPTGEGGHQGGAVAAPVAGEILGEVLPYLEIRKNEEGEIKESVEMPKVEGMIRNEAIKILKNVGLEYEIKGDISNQEGTVVNQLPREKIRINTGTKVILEIK